MESNYWTRYAHIHRVEGGVCPCCAYNKGEYSKRDHGAFFWVLFQCSACGYELREHVMRGKDADIPTDERFREDSVLPGSSEAGQPAVGSEGDPQDPAR